MATRTRIKFCGVCRPEDAAAAAAVGADAVGIVLHAAAGRSVHVEPARAIVSALPPFVTPVGLFVDEPRERVVETSLKIGVRTVQLHGDEDPDDAESLGEVLAVIKAVRFDPAGPDDQLAPWRGRRLVGLVLETPTIGPATGGTGIANDWAGLVAAQAAGRLDNLPPLILAGGLTPETVGDVVRALRPFAVDVSSGIESARRTKSPERMAAFAAAVRAADDAADPDRAY